MRGITVPGFGKLVEETRLAMGMSQSAFGVFHGKPKSSAQTACWDWEKRDRVPHESEVAAKVIDTVQTRHPGMTIVIEGTRGFIQRSGNVNSDPGPFTATDIESVDLKSINALIAQLRDTIARSLPGAGVAITITL